jgi:hypothetical protein
VTDVRLPPSLPAAAVRPDLLIEVEAVAALP